MGVRADGRAGTTNQNLVGVDGPGPVGATSAMAAIGVRWVRTDVSFEGTIGGKPVYDCASGAWNPALLDGRVAQIRREGAQPLVIVDYSPACLATGAVRGDNAGYYPPDLGSDQTRWVRLVEEMAAHEITAEGVTTFEVWNEPDGTFWRGGLPGYLRLYADTARALEVAAAAAHARIAVGGPALVFSDAAWIEPFLDFVAAEDLPLEFLSWHYYADYPLLGPVGPIPGPPPGTPPVWYNPALRAQSYGLQVGQVRAEVAAHPSLHPLLWLDEWNADAGYDARHDGPFDAALAAAVLDSVQSARLDRMCFFDVADDTGNALANWGLLTAPPALAAKPVYAAFEYWHRLGPNLAPVSLSPDQSLADPRGRIGAVASTAPDGQVTILVYDFVPYDATGVYGTADPTPYDHPITVELTGLGPGSYSWQRDLEDGTHGGGHVAGGTVRGRSASLSFTLASEGVTEVVLTPRRG